MRTNNVDAEAKKKAIGALNRNPHAHDLDVVTAILCGHQRNPSFKVVNSALSRPDMAMSETESEALLAQNVKHQKSPIKTRGSPPLHVSRSDEQIVTRSESDVLRPQKSRAAIIRDCALNKNPFRTLMS